MIQLGARLNRPLPLPQFELCVVGELLGASSTGKHAGRTAQGLCGWTPAILNDVSERQLAQAFPSVTVSCDAVSARSDAFTRASSSPEQTEVELPVGLWMSRGTQGYARLCWRLP